MTTLIAVYNSEGCVGRCDAKCYNASTPHCDCICRGSNHGAGFEKAEANVRAYTEKKLRQIEADGGYIPAEIRQARLL